MVQWLRIRLPEQGTRVPYLVWEDPTCLGATKPAHSNKSTLEPQPLKPERPRTPAPQAKVTLNEKPVQPNWRVALTLCKERKLSQARNRLGATRRITAAEKTNTKSTETRFVDFSNSASQKSLPQMNDQILLSLLSFKNLFLIGGHLLYSGWFLLYNNMNQP